MNHTGYQFYTLPNISDIFDVTCLLREGVLHPADCVAVLQKTCSSF